MNFRSRLLDAYRKLLVSSNENSDHLEEIRKKFIINFGGSITSMLFPDSGGLFIRPGGLGKNQTAVEEISRLIAFEETDFNLRIPFHIFSGLFFPYLTLTVMLIESYSLMGTRDEILRLYEPQILEESSLKRESLITKYLHAKGITEIALIPTLILAGIRIFKFKP